MFYEGYHLWGMHLTWWLIWLAVVLWIYFAPYSIPGQRAKKGSALHILKERLSSGQISLDEYKERRDLLVDEKSKWGI